MNIASNMNSESDINPLQTPSPHYEKRPFEILGILFRLLLTG
jgi:hypothetical protein